MTPDRHTACAGTCAAHRVRLELDPAIEHFTAALNAAVAGVDWAALAERAHAVRAEAQRAAGTLSDVQPWGELSQAYRDAWIASVRAVYAEAIGAAVGASATIVLRARRQAREDGGVAGMGGGMTLPTTHPTNAAPVCPQCDGTGIRARTTSGAVLRCSCGARLSTRDMITAECDAIRDMLLEKNEAYGDSAIEPLRVFSRASAEEQILVRIDDKLSRLARGSAAGEDVVADLIGYLVLLRIARERAR